ncbi:unnamed protein product [Protopolystoma xenopodis]|uniref:Uncharacterized protein n=1 Tax=Protopolystoma xenopodis TaxID=117903 RepID=A0A3S5A6U4_9PLAT|nr:unnamed protein product [Protopolystoma xenopodis]
MARRVCMYRSDDDTPHSFAANMSWWRRLSTKHVEHSSRLFARAVVRSFAEPVLVEFAKNVVLGSPINLSAPHSPSPSPSPSSLQADMKTNWASLMRHQPHGIQQNIHLRVYLCVCLCECVRVCIFADTHTHTHNRTAVRRPGER